MKTPPFFIGYFVGALLVFGCTSKDPDATDSLACISGQIVGSRCGVFALKMDKRHTIPSWTWPKPVTKDGQVSYQDIDNVIGILNLPEDLQRDVYPDASPAKPRVRRAESR